MNNYGVEMITVNSSNVAEIGYDGTNQILYVRFTNNTLYIYKGVPVGEFDGLKSAPSIGSYLHKNIKSLFPYEQIE
ncbi:MAG: KTSC domain-containing protein [Candidatus Margulisbacteria bacterium]|nr:KTSC domain-containing protein [Candidatus Margulisiibacteriota bacterium]